MVNFLLHAHIFDHNLGGLINVSRTHAYSINSANRVALVMEKQLMENEITACRWLEELQTLLETFKKDVNKNFDKLRKHIEQQEHQVVRIPILEQLTEALKDCIILSVEQVEDLEKNCCQMEEGV